MTDELGQEPKAIEEKACLLVARGEYEACVEFGNAAIPTLLKHLQSQRNGSTDKVSQVRERLINVLGTILGDREEQRKLVRAKRHVGRLSPDIEQLLLTRMNVATHIAEYLTDEDVGVRVAAINALEKIREPNVGAQLLPLLDDENAKVRVTTIHTLEDVGHRYAIPDLMGKLGDRSLYVADESLSPLPAYRVCDQALKTLLNFGEKTALDALWSAFIDGDNLLRAHAVDGLQEIKRRIEDKSAKTPPFSVYRHPLHANTRIPVPDSEKVASWDEVVVVIEQQGITKLLGELSSDTSPVIEEGLLPTFLEENERLLLHDSPDQAFDSETEAAWAKFQGLLRFQWQRPIGCHGIQGLSMIRTPEAIRLLLNALESSEPDICTDAISALGKWLGDFPDSGWGRHELVHMTPEIEQLRDVTLEKLIGLLQNKTLQVQDSVNVDELVGMGLEVLSIGECAAEALAVSGTEAAESALRSWSNPGQSLDDTTMD